MPNRHFAQVTSARVVRTCAALLFCACAGSATAHVDVLDPHALPLGDGKVSQQPKRGYVYSCETQFHGGGAQQAGDWIHGSTWDLTRKIAVQGDVAWPQARFTIITAGNERRFIGNGLPIDHTTGEFPVRTTDPAYRFDRNPNSIAAQQLTFSLPLLPAPAAAPNCVPMGMMGVALDGVAIFNALDASGRDAAAHEVQDHCNGHPQMHGEYHYHGPTSCLAGATGSNTLVGYAMDGFGIYSIYDENGRELTNADLDECHGRTSRIVWDGKPVTMYHYVLTREYPYTIGCFRGNALRTKMQGTEPPQGGPRDGPADGPPREPESGPRRPPPEALDACANSKPGAQCRFTSPRGDAVVGTCRTPGGPLACVPDMR